MLLVNLVNYTNPTGLCAECQTPLYTSNPEGIIPVCCDELPYKNNNCNNTGVTSCDTRFRWTIRPFGASLETRSEIGFAGFTDCTLSNTTCPFSEISATFSQGEGGILGVTDNPLIINSSLSTPVGTCMYTLLGMPFGLKIHDNSSQECDLLTLHNITLDHPMSIQNII